MKLLAETVHKTLELQHNFTATNRRNRLGHDLGDLPNDYFDRWVELTLARDTMSLYGLAKSARALNVLIRHCDVAAKSSAESDARAIHEQRFRMLRIFKDEADSNSASRK
jgi:hypothetical protein